MMLVSNLKFLTTTATSLLFCLAFPPGALASENALTVTKAQDVSHYTFDDLSKTC